MKQFLYRILILFLLLLFTVIDGCSYKIPSINYFEQEESRGIIIELDNNLKEIWSSREYIAPACYTKTKDGDKLISDAHTNYSYRIDNENNILWMYLSRGICYLSETDDGTYMIASDRSDEGVKEVDKFGKILWSMTGKQGKKEAIKIDAGKYLVSDWQAKTLSMYDRKNNILWQNKDIMYPSSIQSLGNGEYLVTDAEHYRLVEINKQGKIFWEFTETKGKPFIARKINDNKYIIGYKGLPLIKVIDRQGKQLDVIHDIYANNIMLLPDGHIGIAGVIQDRNIENDAPLRKKQESIIKKMYK